MRDFGNLDRKTDFIVGLYWKSYEYFWWGLRKWYSCNTCSREDCWEQSRIWLGYPKKWKSLVFLGLLWTRKRAELSNAEQHLKRASIMQYKSRGRLGAGRCQIVLKCVTGSWKHTIFKMTILSRQWRSLILRGILITGLHFYLGQVDIRVSV